MFQRRVQIGLDLGSHSMKCAVVDVESRHIRHLWEEELPAEGTTEQVQQHVANTMSGWSRRLPHEARGVNVAVQGSGTWCMYRELPALSQKELETAVPTLAATQLPFAADSAVLSFLSVPPLSGDCGKKGVFIVAAQKGRTSALCSMLQASGMVVERLDLSALAMLREFTSNHQSPRHQLTALLNIGWQHCLLVVARDGFPYYVRHYTPAGRDFASAVLARHELSRRQALTVLSTMDVSCRTWYMEPVLRRWTEETARTLRCFGERAPATQTVQQVVLSGGLATMPGLAARLAEKLERPVTVDSWRRIQPTASVPQTAPTVYKVAVGMAIQD